MNIKPVLILVMLFSPLSLFCLAADNTLTIATSVKTNTLSFRVGEKVLSHLSLQLKVPLKLVHIPADRASHLFNLGKIDAEFSRAALYQQIRSTAIKAQEPISKLPLYVFTADKRFTVNGWQSLRPYRILTIKGWVYTKKSLVGFDTVEVESPFQALRMLKAGRADLFVTDMLSVNSLRNDLEFNQGDIIRLDNPVTVLNTYTFFLAKHTAIAKAYSEALITLKREGTYQQILQDTL